MSSKSIRIKHYKADELYSSLFRSHMIRNFTGVRDVVVHHVQTNIDGITHIVSVEITTESGERVLANITVVAGRNTYIVTELPKKLIGKIYATW